MAWYPAYGGGMTDDPRKAVGVGTPAPASSPVGTPTTPGPGPAPGAPPAPWQAAMGGAPPNYNLTQVGTTSPFQTAPGTSLDPSLYNYWANTLGLDIYGNPTFGAQQQAAMLTGKFQGQDTLTALQQKQADLLNQANIARMQGDSARADQAQKLAQQIQDQANAAVMSGQTGMVAGTGTGPGQVGGQLSIGQRNFYLQQYGYDPGPQGMAGATQYGGQNIAGRQQTEAEKAAERLWQFQQASMAANPENAATVAAMRGTAPWQQGAMGGGGQAQMGQAAAGGGRPQSANMPFGGEGVWNPAGQYEAPVASQGQDRYQVGGQPSEWREAMAGGQGQAGVAEQNSPDWARAGMAAPRGMDVKQFDIMSPSQKAAFGSYAKAAGGSAGDYEKQLSTYRPQKTQAATGVWG